MTWQVVVICCSVWLLLKIIVWPQMLLRWRWWVHFVHHCHCHCWPIVANSGHLKVSIQIVFGRITILFCFSCSSTVVGVVATPLQVGIRNNHIWQRCLRGKYKKSRNPPERKEVCRLILSIHFASFTFGWICCRFCLCFVQSYARFTQSRCSVRVWMEILLREKEREDRNKKSQEQQCSQSVNKG